MTQNKRPIPNPNRISDSEKDFVSVGKNHVPLEEDSRLKEEYKGRMISMPNSFYNQLNNYLKKHPTEGSRSSFIVRVVAEYIEKKQ